MVKIIEATTHNAEDIARLTGALLSEIMEATHNLLQSQLFLSLYFIIGFYATRFFLLKLIHQQ